MNSFSKSEQSLKLNHNNIRFPRITILRRSIEELNAIGNSLIVVRFGVVIGAARRLGRLHRPIITRSPPRRRRLRRAAPRREAPGEDEPHYDLAKPLQQFHA